MANSNGIVMLLVGSLDKGLWMKYNDRVKDMVEYDAPPLTPNGYRAPMPYLLDEPMVGADLPGYVAGAHYKAATAPTHPHGSEAMILPLLLATVHVVCLPPPKGTPVLMDINPYHIAQAYNYGAQA